MDLLGPDIFLYVMNERTSFACERAHLKVSEWSLVWNEILTKKLAMFLSRLNEISRGCEKIVPFSESFWSNLKFLRMIDLTAWLWGWNVRVNGMRSVFSFSAVFSADCRSICWARRWPAWNKRTTRWRFREHLREVERNDKNASKPVTRHFNLPNHSKQRMAVCDLSSVTSRQFGKPQNTRKKIYLPNRHS